MNKLIEHKSSERVVDFTKLIETKARHAKISAPSPA